MSPAARPPGSGSGTTSLVGLAVLGLLGALGRKPDRAAAPRDAGAPGRAPRHDGRSMPPDSARRQGDSAPGEAKPGVTDVASGVRAYGIGLGLAVLLTAGSFWLSTTHLVYGPALYMALIVFAVAQIGIHLVFFLHITTSPDNINNAMALAFGVLILGLLIGGTLWIMAHMNANMMPMAGMGGHAMAPGAMMNMAP